MLISTLKEIFQGRQNLFQSLWIHDKIDWEPRPVIHLDFSEMVGRDIPLRESINTELDRLAEEAGFSLSAASNDQKFRELIQLLGKDRKVAILVDEYDKPIIDYIDHPEKAAEQREILKNFYSVVKANDDKIHFLLLTGVSKFSHVSIFSDLNNLYDISTDSTFAKMLGYTEDDLRTYFSGYIAELQEEYKVEFPDIFATIKEWYNGYSWDGRTFVYNPFSILSLLQKQVFQDYWFQTGTPTFLMKLIRKNNYSIFDLQNNKLDFNYFNRFDISNIEVNSLLFQTGYLTIKAHDRASNIVTLDFPNREVEQAFSIHLLSEFSGQSKEHAGSLLFRMNESLESGEADRFIELLREMFLALVYPNIEHREKYYHSIFYLTLKLLGYKIESEVLTSRGRIDAVITGENFVYVIEFKLGSAESALSQIKEKQYHLQFLNSGKRIVLLGIGFDEENRNIGDYQIEEVSR